MTQHSRPSSSPWVGLLICSMMLLTGPAQAATTVYRCGQTYQDVPCETGGRTVDVSDQRDAGQQAQARQAAAAEKKLAQDQAKDRLARDKALKPQTQAAGLPAPTSALPDATPDADADCGKPGKAHAKSRKSKGPSTVCGDAKVRYAVTPPTK
jgi:hypothetical protein